jgi:recombinational DNA repair ATPase RecF
VKITKLVLKKYKRLMMSNIQYVEFNPSKTMQLLIGSNGSGKSSILEELTPIPAHHAGFLKGGVKEIHLTHGTSVYALVSVYEHGTGKHSFIKDGEELNTGGTFAIQRELVEQEFRLNRNIHELFTGLTTFTSMPTNKRREWLTMLSTVDLTYAFGVHNKVKSQHRDQLGVIKHLTKRMSNEHHDLPDDSVMSGMRENLRKLTNKLNDLFLHRKQGVSPAFRDEAAVKGELEALLTHAKQLLTLYPTLPQDIKVDGREAFNAELNEQFSQHRTMVAVVDQLVEELEGIRQRTPSKDDTLSVEQIDQIRMDLNQAITEAEQFNQQAQQYQGPFPLVRFDTHGNPLDRLSTLFDRWLGLINSFPDNESGRMNSVDARANKDRLVELKGQHRQQEDQHTLLARRLANYRGCAEVVCPFCTHTFKPGVNPNEVRDLEARVEALGTLAEATERQIKELSEWLEEFDTYSGFVYNFRLLTQDFTQFAPLWDYCTEEQVMYRTPKRYTTHAVQWYQAMQAQVKAELALDRADVLRKKLQYVEAIDKDALGYLDQRRQELELQIEQRTHEANTQKVKASKLQRAGLQIEGLETEIRDTLNRFAEFSRKFQQQVEYQVQRALEEETRLTQLQLADQQANLHRMEMREHTLNALEKDHREATELHHDLGVLVKALSPTDGLIGRYLMGFMQVVVKLMNAVINEIWTYPLEVLPSKVDKDELDYNFPLDVNGGQVVAPDISRGSSSQRDIVNFAFKLMVMKFLHYEDYPLYLDEFGSTFDEQHRENLIPFLARMIELDQVKQVFYISHYTTTHGAFNQAEIFVLDPTNITVPDHYNQHVTLG